MNNREWATEWLQAWNEAARAYGMRGASALSPWRLDRITKARALEGNLAVWEAAFRSLGADPFYTGTNNRRWKANAEYVLRNQSMADVLDRGYDELSASDDAEERRQGWAKLAADEANAAKAEREGPRTMRIKED